MESEARTPGVNPEGQLLLDAIRKQNIDEVLRLLQNGVDVDTKDENENRALSIAAGIGSCEIVQTLLRFDAKIHVDGEKREAPLVAAALHSHLDVVRLLKDRGMDEWERRQALLDAVRNGHLPIVEELWVVPRDLNWEQSGGSGINYLSVAAESGHHETAAFLLSQGASQLSLKTRWTSPLHKAAAKGYTSIARLLVDHGADLLALNPRGFTPLLVACFDNQTEVAGYLASKMDSFDLDIRGDSHIAAIHFAIFKGNAPLVHKLLECHADPDGHPGDISAPLHMAISMNLSTIAIDLLDHEADFHSRDSRGLTCLHRAAASSNCLSLIKRFLDNGLDANDQSSEGFTPLYRAVEFDNVAAVEVLLNHQANPNKATRLGLSPLHEAAAKGNDKVVELLLKGGADVDAVAFDKTKPIHLAAANWKPSVIQKLLTHHSAISDIDGYGTTTWQYAANHAPTLAALNFGHAPTDSDRSADTSTIEKLRSETLSKMVSLYRELCMKAKNPEAEQKLIVGLTSSLLPKHEISLLHRFYKTWEPLWEVRHGYELRFTCFSCYAKASFRELHRCVQCFPVCICTQCDRLHTAGSGVQQCSGHEIIHLFGEEEVSCQSPRMADLDSAMKEILEKSNLQVEQTTISQNSLPLRPAIADPSRREPESMVPIANVAAVASPTFIAPDTSASPVMSDRIMIPDTNLAFLAPSELDPSETVPTEGLQEVSAVIDGCLKTYAAAQNDETVLVKAINIIRETLPFTSLKMPEYMDFRFKLIIATLEWYRTSKAEVYSAHDLDSILGIAEEIISLYSQTSPKWIPCCLAFVWFCNRRVAMEKKTMTSVERYITILEDFRPVAENNDLLKDDSATQVAIHRLLSELYKLEYDRDSMMKDLDNAIIFKRSAIFQDMTIAQDDREPYYDLGMLLCSRYERTGLKADISECIDMLKMYNDLVPKSSLDRAIGLSNLAHAMDLRYKNAGTRQETDLDEALEIVQEAIQIAEKFYPKMILVRGEMMTNLGNILSRRYEAFGAIEDLEASIDASRKSLNQLGISDDTKAVRCNNLAYRLRMRYQRTKNFASVQEGISIAEQAFSLRNVERHTTCLLLNTVVGLLAEKFHRDEGSKADWNRAVRAAKIAVGSEPSLSSRIAFMQTLSAVLTERYEKFHDEKDLTEAIDCGFRCLRNTSVSHSLRSAFLTGVGSRFGLLYSRTSNVADLDCALGLHNAAVQLNPLNEIAVNNLHAATMNRWYATKDKEDLRLAIDRMESHYQNPTFSNFGRVRGATAAGVLAMELGDYGRASVLLKGAVSLLPEVYLPLIDRKDLQHVLSQLSGLPERIASALLLNSNQSTLDALELMESARGIIASLAINARRHDKIPVQVPVRTNLSEFSAWLKSFYIYF
jgi:ankyrin repeat protein/tetratricopeptide (TPR) repeat protein